MGAVMDRPPTGSRAPLDLCRELEITETSDFLHFAELPIRVISLSDGLMPLMQHAQSAEELSAWCVRSDDFS